MEKNKWLTCAEVMTQWGVNKITLGDYILNKIIPVYSISNFSWLDVQPADMRGYIQSDRGKRKARSWTLADIIDNLDDLVFSVKDVEAFEKKHGSIGKPEVVETTPNETEKGIRKTKLSFSENFECAYRGRQRYALTPKQGRVCKRYLTAAKNGRPELSGAAVLGDLFPNTTERSLSHVFKANRKLFEILFEQVSKGVFRLKEPLENS
jgi:hypothetical protein